MSVPALGNHIEIYRSSQNGVTIYNSNTDKTYSIGEKEATVLSMLDGKRNIHQLQQACTFYSEEQLRLLIHTFAELGLFTKQKKKINPFKIKIRLWNPNGLFEPESRLTKVLNATVFYLCPIFFAAGVLGTILMRFFFKNGQESIYGLTQALSSLNVLDYIVILIGLFISLFLHETAHAVSARRYDVNVPEIGVMLYCLFPCAYTNVSGIHLLSKSFPKIKVLLSGTLVNLGIIGILELILAILPTVHASLILYALLFINAMIIVMNTMVFLKFDGYYVLEVITGLPQLKELSVGYLRDLLTVKHFRQNIASTSEPVNEVLYFVFGLTSVLFVPIIVLNTVIPLIQFFLR